MLTLKVLVILNLLLIGFVFQAVMKIVKHCHEECAGNLEVAQGALLGIVVENRLEITNCFAFPKNYDEDEGKNFDSFTPMILPILVNIECTQNCSDYSCHYKPKKQLCSVKGKEGIFTVENLS